MLARTDVSDGPGTGELHRSKLPGADDDTPLFAVSRGGSTVDGVRTLPSHDLISAWRTP